MNNRNGSACMEQANMLVLTKAHPQRGIWASQKPIPSIQPDEVLIQVQKSAICGTDVHIFNWDHWAQNTIPLGTTIGHEYLGQVVQVGSQVTKFALGDRVTSEGHIVCHRCRYCRSGRYHLCPQTLGTGIQRDGAFAEYIAVPEFNVLRVPDYISDNSAAILDPFGNAINTVYKAVSENTESALITGAGPIGILAARTLQFLGIDTWLYDVNDTRIELARSMGVEKVGHADHINDGTALMADIGLEMAGSNEALQFLMSRVRNGGQIAVLGLPSTPQALDLSDLIFKEIKVQGVYGREMFETWDRMYQLLHSGLDISPVITHEVDVAEYQYAFEMAAGGEAGKVIINWTH